MAEPDTTVETKKKTQKEEDGSEEEERVTTKEESKNHKREKKTKHAEEEDEEEVKEEEEEKVQKKKHHKKHSKEDSEEEEEEKEDKKKREKKGKHAEEEDEQEEEEEQQSKKKHHKKHSKEDSGEEEERKQKDEEEESGSEEEERKKKKKHHKKHREEDSDEEEERKQKKHKKRSKRDESDEEEESSAEEEENEEEEEEEERSSSSEEERRKKHKHKHRRSSSGEKKHRKHKHSRHSKREESESEEEEQEEEEEAGSEEEASEDGSSDEPKKKHKKHHKHEKRSKKASSPPSDEEEQQGSEEEQKQKEEEEKPKKGKKGEGKKGAAAEKEEVVVLPALPPNYDKDAETEEERARKEALKKGGGSTVDIDGEPLPAGWEMRIDQSSGREYYINHKTKTTQWYPPSQAAEAAPVAQEIHIEPYQPPIGRGILKVRSAPKIEEPAEGDAPAKDGEEKPASAENPETTDEEPVQETAPSPQEEFMLDVLSALRTAITLSYWEFIYDENGVPQPGAASSSAAEVGQTVQTTAGTPNKGPDGEVDIFGATQKHKISRPGAKNLLVVKDYAPEVFNNVRLMFGINSGDYLESWINPPLPEKSQGKSGALMIHSRDKRFILKTISDGEAKLLFEMLPEYYQFLTTNPDTLLPKYFGLHRLTRGHEELYFVVFNNVLDPNVPVHEMYDMKGSTVGRTAVDPTKANVSQKTLKDLDFNRSLKIQEDKRTSLFTQIEKDCEFLQAHKIMDYSLLIGIHFDDTDTDGRSIVFSGSGGASVSKDPLPSPSPVPASSGSPEPGSSRSISPSSGFVCFVEESFAPQFKKVAKKTGLKEKPSPSSADLPPINERTWMGLASSEPVKGHSERYYLGIVDALQKFDTLKKFALFAKSLKHEKEGLSTADPEFYSKRFRQMVHRIVL